MKIILPLWIALSCCWYVSRQPANEQIVVLARDYVGITEDQPNRSKDIDHWNSRLDLPLGSNYCASFVAFLLDSVQASFPKVRSGVAQHYITGESIKAKQVAGGRQIPPGYLVVWKRGNTWQGHIEIVKKTWTGPKGYTIGANTTSGESADQRNGNGVYERHRAIIPTAYFRIEYFTPVY